MTSSRAPKQQQQDGGGEKLSDVSLDLMGEILSKLSMKSLVKLRCVSKLWSSLITDLIRIRSTQPRLLVISHDWSMLQSSLFSSSTYPLNTNRNFISADRSGSTGSYALTLGRMYRYARGLTCCLTSSDQFRIHNPTTGQSVLLPEIQYDKDRNSINGFFGYDPAENHYKVLCYINGPGISEFSCRIFTLGGSRGQRWRNLNIQGNLSPAKHTSVCINGIIYCIADSSMFRSRHPILVMFDVRFERVDCIQMPVLEGSRDFRLVNYQGKLGCIRYGDDRAEMWIMEDRHSKKREWSKIILSMHHTVLKSLGYSHCIAGVSPYGEIVIMPKKLKSDQKFCAQYYDPKENKTRRVEFETPLKGDFINVRSVCICCILDHMENTLPLLDLFT